VFVEILFFLILLLILAAFVKGSFVFTIFYLFLGAFVISALWNRQAARHLTFERKVEKRFFLGEEIPVKLEIRNTGWLPVPWLYFHESLPVELAGGGVVRRLLSLGGRTRTEFTYNLHAYKRGRYRVGPLSTQFGDTLGLFESREFDGLTDHVVIYPRILPFSDPGLPSRSPQGNLRHHQPLFEDPARPRGKRGYVSGDSLRRVDWKASAATGRLQVKQFEPSISLQTAIFLGLGTDDYTDKNRIDSSELAIVIAASLASWLVSRKQSVGLVTNGRDAGAGDRAIQPLPIRKGRGHLMRLLELLACVQTAPDSTITARLRDETPHLPWGTTLVVITGRVDETLFDQLFAVRRRGQNVVLVIAGRASGVQKARQQAGQFGFPVHIFPDEKSLDAWRAL
jgi:uncharacterized protein (DUF58 family)